MSVWVTQRNTQYGRCRPIFGQEQTSIWHVRSAEILEIRGSNVMELRRPTPKTAQAYAPVGFGGPQGGL
jgi:hypothetical protein